MPPGAGSARGRVAPTADCAGGAPPPESLSTAPDRNAQPAPPSTTASCHFTRYFHARVVLLRIAVKPTPPRPVRQSGEPPVRGSGISLGRARLAAAFQE